jgi:hypothetical protein
VTRPITTRWRGSHGKVLDAPTLKQSWWITVEDTARIWKLRKEIVRRLEIIEAEPALRELAWPDPGRWNDAARIGHALSPLGVERARPIRLPDGGPKVIIIPRILGGAKVTPNGLPVWAVRFLTDTHPDVRGKLAESGYPELHAFIWTTFTTPYEIASTLDGEAFPTQAPELPDGATHLWVGSWYAGRRTLYWRPDYGWSEAYRIPLDGPVELPDC